MPAAGELRIGQLFWSHGAVTVSDDFLNMNASQIGASHVLQGLQCGGVEQNTSGEDVRQLTL